MDRGDRVFYSGRRVRYGRGGVPRGGGPGGRPGTAVVNLTELFAGESGKPVSPVDFPTKILHKKVAGECNDFRDMVNLAGKAGRGGPDRKWVISAAATGEGAVPPRPAITRAAAVQAVKPETPHPPLTGHLPPRGKARLPPPGAGEGRLGFPQPRSWRADA